MIGEWWLVSIAVGVLLLFFAMASGINGAYKRCDELERRAREDRVALGALLDFFDEHNQSAGLPYTLRKQVWDRARVRLDRGWDEPLERGGA